MRKWLTGAIVLTALIMALYSSCSEPAVEEGVNSLRLGGACYVEVANSDTMKSIFSDDFSLEIWAMADTSLPADARTLVMVGNDNGGDEIAIFQGADDSSLIEVFIDEQLFGSFSIAGLDWRSQVFHYLCLTEAENVVTFFFDGNRVKSKLIAGLAIDIGASHLLIGADYDLPGVNTNVGNYWEGYFDEVRLWRRCIESAEVQFHANNPDKLLEHYVPDDLATLAGLWRFNAAFTGSSFDESGCGHSTTLQGTLANITWSTIGAQ